MNRFKWILSIAVLGVLSLGLIKPGVSTVEASTYTDSISGFEYAFTSVEGRFAGTATGDLPGLWDVDVFHTPLTTTATITGGSFSLWTIIEGNGTQVVGTFADGGTITQTSGFSGCVNQQYAIEGTLENVGTAGGDMDGLGDFSAVLTHHRKSIFGRCITYFATVNGTVSLYF